MKISNLLSIFQRSIFVKLFLVLFLTGFLAIIAVTFFFQMQYNLNIKQPVYKNISNYFQYIAQEIGSPPDTLKARKIAEEFSIYINYESPDFKWASQYDNNIRETFRRRRYFSRHDPNSIFHRSNIILNPDGSRFIFRTDFDKFMGNHNGMFTLLLLFLFVIFFLHYLLIKRILKPVNWLTTGVNQVGQGNLSYQIPVKSKDELGKLTSSFNSMATQIKQMIKSKDQLLLDVSHELRSPITRMKVALEFLKNEKVRKSIEDDLLEMEYMIAEILETERLKGGYGKLTLKRLNLVQIFKDVSLDYKDRMPVIDISNLPDEVYLDLDEERIKTVFKNILENAYKYSLPDSQAIRIKIDEEEQSLLLFITDDGIGVPEEHIPNLFEPFYRIDKSRSKDTGGYGLGLSLCKKIIRAHRGEIKIYNNENARGVTILIRFRKALSA